MDLGEKWEAVEALCRDTGWWMDRLERLSRDYKILGRARFHHVWWEATASGPMDAVQVGSGSTPAEALDDLFKIMREAIARGE